MENISWDDLRVLLAVHRAGSLLGAGRLLGLSTSTTGRRLDALEAAVGAKLVHRDPKGAELAPAAVRLVQLAEGFEHGLHAQKRDQELLAGTIKVSVPDGLAAPITQALMNFHREHPGIDIELVGENRMADVARREADIALRLAHSTSNFLVQKQVVTLRFSLFASADYARRRLPDRRLRKQDASAHNFIGLDTRWKELPQEKWMVQLGAIRFALRSSSMDAVKEAVRQGMGLAALVEQEAQHADLVRLTTESAGPTQPLYLVYHRDLRNAPHLRAAVKSIETYIRALR